MPARPFIVTMEWAMCRMLLGATLMLFAAQAAHSQPAWTPNVVLAFSQPASTPLPQPANAHADDIQALKANILQLQDRLDRLSPPAADSPTEHSKDKLSFAEGSPLLPASATQCKKDGAADWPLTASWNHGLQFASRDDVFRVHVGGLLHFDYGWNDASQAVQSGPGGIGDLQDGALLRRARVRIDGTMYQHIDWVAEYDFANTVENDTASGTQTIGTPSFINAWIGINDIPIAGTVRAGWMKEPISFEFLKSGRWLNFMERTPGTNSFFTRSVGAMLLNTNDSERVTWAFGVFHSENDNFGFGFGDGQYAEVGRLTWLPWYEDEGQRLLHLGIGAKHGHLNQDEITFRGRPSVRTMPGSKQPALADTGSIGGDNQDMLDVELAAVCGPWTIQSEYYCTFIHDAVFPNTAPPQGVPLGTLFYQGTYLELLYFLTGEYQAYDLQQATFGRVVPRRNFNIWLIFNTSTPHLPIS